MDNQFIINVDLFIHTHQTNTMDADLKKNDEVLMSMSRLSFWFFSSVLCFTSLGHLTSPGSCHQPPVHYQQAFLI